MGNSLVVQSLGLGTFMAEDLSSIPYSGTKIPQALWHDQKLNKIISNDTQKGGGGSSL